MASNFFQHVAANGIAAPPPFFGNHPPAAAAYQLLPGGPIPYVQQPTISPYQQTHPSQQQPVALYGPVAQPPHFGNHPPAAGTCPPCPGGLTPYSQQPTISLNQQTNPSQQQSVVSNGPQPPQYSENLQLSGGVHRPQSGGSAPSPQQPPISMYQQTYPGQQQSVVSNGPAPTQYSENLQLSGGVHRPQSVGQTPSIQQPTIRYNQQTIPGQQQSFPCVDYSPTSHEISDNLVEMQRLSIVKSFIEAFIALRQPADMFRVGIRLSNEIGMFYEQGQTNHHREPNLGELELSDLSFNA